MSKKLNISKKYLTDNYIIKNKGVNTIANESGYSTASIRKYLKQYNIKIRPPGGEFKYNGGKYISGAEFSSIRSRAKKKHLEFNINIEYIENLYEKQNKLCALTHVSLYFNSRSQKLNKKGNASIDRIDSSKGYIKGNIQIIHKDVNTAKMALNTESFIDMCYKISSIYTYRYMTLDYQGKWQYNA